MRPRKMAEATTGAASSLAAATQSVGKQTTTSDVLPESEAAVPAGKSLSARRNFISLAERLKTAFAQEKK